MDWHKNFLLAGRVKMSEILNLSLVNTAPSHSSNEHKKTRMLSNRETYGDVNHGEPFHHLVVLFSQVWYGGWAARLDRGVGSPVYMVNQTTRHKVRMKRGEFILERRWGWRSEKFVRPGGILLCLRELWRARLCFLFYCFPHKTVQSSNVLRHHIYRWLCTFSVSAVTIMFCVRPKVALQCDIALCKRCTLASGLCNKKKKKLSLPGGAE